MLGGCAQVLNERVTLGGMHLSPSLDSSASAVPLGGERLLNAPVMGDRSRWGVTQFIVVFDGVVHAPILRIEPPLRAQSSGRFYGRYPETIEVLDPQARSWGEDLRFTLDELGRSLIGTPFAVGYLGWHGELGEPSLSPRPYKRTDQDGWSSGFPAPIKSNGATTHE